MRLPRPLLVLLPAAATAATAMSWGCETLQSGLKYDFKSLAGPHKVISSRWTPPTTQNTTWIIDPCGPLQKDKDSDAKEQCQAGTYGRSPRDEAPGRVRERMGTDMWGDKP